MPAAQASQTDRPVVAVDLPKGQPVHLLEPDAPA